ncbi:MAG: hypothetical protein IIW10_04580 [Spirochaetaceae bacterium]|nr:hypothetical protein [Spirochaetaceae bacterium]
MKQGFLSVGMLIFLLPVYSQGLSPQSNKKLGEIFITGGINNIFNIDGWSVRKTVDDPMAVSAPGPIIFTLGGGCNFIFKDAFAFSPTLFFFGNYYLWEGDRAYPAEIEHRTSLALNFLLDLPFVYYFRWKDFYFSGGIGLAANMRIAALAQGVPDGDKDDSKEIQNFFWENLNFLYPSLQLNCDFITSHGISAGLGVRLFLSVGSWVRKASFFDGAYLSAFFRITLEEMGLVKKIFGSTGK